MDLTENLDCHEGEESVRKSLSALSTAQQRDSALTIMTSDPRVLILYDVV